MMVTSVMPDVIVTARWIIQNAKEPVLEGHGVAIENGRILDIASLSLLKKRYPGIECRGSDRFAMMPGFVNAHHHSFGVSSILRGVPDQVLEPWIVEMSGAPSLPKALAARLAATSLLRSGVTTTVDMYGGVGSIDEFADGVTETAKGYRESGLKTILAPGMPLKTFFLRPMTKMTPLLTACHRAFKAWPRRWFAGRDLR